jgi:hypothetical protein
MEMRKTSFDKGKEKQKDVILQTSMIFMSLSNFTQYISE